MKLHLEAWGDPGRPALVCVHGVTAHGNGFAPLVREGLADAFYVLAPDLRGHGCSDWEPPWRVEQHLEDLLETVPATAALWLGHSFGGRLVLELAARHPERVARAMLLDPALWVPPPIALEEAEALRPDVSYATLAEAVAARLDSGADHAPNREAVEETFASHLARGDDGRLRFRYSRSAAIAAYGEMAQAPPLQTLTRPVCIARARASRVCPTELIDVYRESAGELLTTVELPGGHIVMWDAAAETARAVLAFMSS